MIVDDPINFFLNFLDVNESPPSKIRNDSFIFLYLNTFILNLLTLLETCKLVFNWIIYDRKSYRVYNINEKCSITL